MKEILSIYSSIFAAVFLLHITISLFKKYTINMIIGDPFIFFSVLFGFTFLLRPYILIYHDPAMIGGYSLDEERLNLVLLLSLISYICICMTYWLFRGKVQSKGVYPYKMVCSSKCIKLIILISILALIPTILDFWTFGANLTRVHLPGDGATFYFIGILFKQILFPIIIIQIYILLFYKLKRRYFIMLFLLLLSALLTSFIGGGRASLLFMIFSFLIMYLYKHRYRKIFRSVAVLMSVIFSSILFLTTLSTYRRIILLDDDSLSFSNFIFQYMQSPSQSLNNFLTKFSWDFSMFDVFVKILDYYDGATYYGYTFMAALIGMIPRVIWTDKPYDIGTMLITTMDLYPGLHESQGTGLIGTYLGEAFMNFGVIGIALYSIVFGILFSLYHKKIFSTSGLFLLPFAAIFYPQIFSIVRGGIDWIWMFLIFKFIPLYIGIRYIHHRSSIIQVK
jgi:oligosaccharide repeat unit polymerase